MLPQRLLCSHSLPHSPCCSLSSRLLTSLSQDRRKCCVTKCTRNRKKKRTLLAFSTCEVRFLIVARVALESVLPLALSNWVVESTKNELHICLFVWSLALFVTWQTTTILTLYQQFWMLNCLSNCCHASPTAFEFNNWSVLSAQTIELWVVCKCV